MAGAAAAGADCPAGNRRRRKRGVDRTAVEPKKTVCPQ